VATRRQSFVCGLGSVLSEKSIPSSCGKLVLVQKTAQAIPTTDTGTPPTSGSSGWTVLGGDPLQRKDDLVCRRHLLPQPLMRAVGVVVTGVDTQDSFEMATTHDYQVVEALRAYGANKSLGIGVHVGGLDSGLRI
jgi:hypothetical protein